jgi:hypothetical protein
LVNINSVSVAFGEPYHPATVISINKVYILKSSKPEQRRKKKVDAPSATFWGTHKIFAKGLHFSNFQLPISQVGIIIACITQDCND